MAPIIIPPDPVFGYGLCECGCGRKTTINGRGVPNLMLKGHGKRRKSFRESFYAWLVRNEATGCLIWTGTKNRQGYGRIYLNGRLVLAHRVAWLLAGNDISDDKPCILHNCPSGDNPACCEPGHLWAGTMADNQADMARKGRSRKSRKGLPLGVAKVGKRFAATYTLDCKGIYLGRFSTAEEAALAVLAERKRLKGW